MMGWRAWDVLAQDLRLGLRLLARNRLFALFSIVSLALGIGGTTGVFALYDTIVLRELPVPAPDRLVTLSIQRAGTAPSAFVPFPLFDAIRQGTESLDGIFARRWIPTVNVRVDNVAQVASGWAVTGDYHRTLGVRPAIGRLLTAGDDRPGSTAVAVISHAYWHRRFDERPAIIGTTIQLNQVPFEVVGVEPEGFSGVVVGLAPEVTIPLHAAPLLSGSAPQTLTVSVEAMGRLRTGVSLEQATLELEAIYRQASRDTAGVATSESASTGMSRETRIHLASGASGGVSSLRTRYKESLRLLLMLVSGVLGLAGLNVAALLFARGEARRAEIATRLALGATRGRIVRQLLTESAVIAACGSTLGLLVAWRGSQALLHIATPNTMAAPINLTPDARILAFIASVSVASCLVFGLLPALRTIRSLRVTPKADVGGRRRRLLDRGLVTTQTAVALVLIVCAGLFLRSLQQLWTQGTGYDRRNVLMFSIDAGHSGKRGAEARQIYRRVLEELQIMPAAQAVTLSIVRPVSDLYTLVDRVTPAGGRLLPADAAVQTVVDLLAPGYFGTMSIPLLAGRDFDLRDTPEAPKVAIVSEQLARHFQGNPVGQRLTVGKDDLREIVGVAADTRYASVKDTPREVLYLPFFQSTPGFTPTYEIKYVGVAADVLRAAADAVERVDPALALFRAKTLEAQTQESFARERLLAWLTTYFGALAWLLAGIGLYGLLSYTVAQRTPEFGLRMALGAQPTDIGLTVMRESVGTVLVGLAVGVGAALMVVRLVRTQLYGVEPADPIALAGAILALLVLAIAASFVPAHRASHIEPIVALRHE
jgi:predicted permease